MTEPLPRTEIPPEPPTDAPAGPPAATPRRPTYSELALGGALLLGDGVTSRLEAIEPPAEPPRALSSVLRPAAEWDDADPWVAARRTTVGLLSDARTRAVRGGRLIDDATDALGRTLDRATRRLRRGRLLRPVRAAFHRYEDRGTAMVAGWNEAGRRAEARSRAVAEVSLNTLMQRSVSDLTQNEGVQVLVQQVVQSQSTGLVEELIEEIRERMVTLDLTLAQRARRSTVEAPPFRHVYLRARPTLANRPDVERTLGGHYAGFASRTVALLIDVTLLMVALSLTTTFINAIFGLFNIEALLGRFIPADGMTGAVGAGLAGLAGTLLVIAYGVTGWGINGQTLGGLLMGIRVVRADGRRLSFGRAVLRMIGSYLSGLALFIGFLWALFDRRHQGWHDKLAGSVVVYDWPAVPDELFLRERLEFTITSPAQRPDRRL